MTWQPDYPWRPDLDSYRAEFYSATEPYERFCCVVSATTAEGLRDAVEGGERRWRELGRVTLRELPVEAQEKWAKHDAEWLVYGILDKLTEEEPSHSRP